MAEQIARSPLVDEVTIHIESPSAGNFQLRQVKGMDVTDNDTGEIIKGPSGVIGQTFSEGGYTVSLDVHRSLVAEVNWVGLKTAGPGNSRERFVLAMQDVNGARAMLEDCQVIKVDFTASADGAQTQKVEIQALTLRIVQAA